MKFWFMKEHRSEFPVSKMSKALGVSASGFYRWLKRLPSKAAVFKQSLQEKIRQIYDSHNGTAGSRTIAADLKGLGIEGASRTRVASEMQEMDLRCKTRKRFVATTDSKHNEPVAPNILEQNFTQNAPNRAWVSDITYLPVNDKWFYLVVFIDLFSRKVVGWDLSPSLKAESTIKAFEQAVCQRRPQRGLIVHSDRGIQYACKDFRQCLDRYACIQSMSRKGNCWDNAVAESFFSSLKKRLFYHRRYETMEDLRKDLFWYIEVYYNRFRKHSFNNYLTPEEKDSIFILNYKSVA
jgi:putative transposase